MSGIIIGDYNFARISDVHNIALHAAAAASDSCSCAKRHPAHPNGPLLYHGKPTREQLEHLSQQTVKFSPCAAACNVSAKNLKEAAACRLGCIMRNSTVPSEQQDPAGPCIDACAMACKGNLECLEACAVQCVAETYDQRHAHCTADDVVHAGLW